MNNQIFCGLAPSIKPPSKTDENLTIKTIESNQDIIPPDFSILVLDKTSYSLYSSKTFISEKDFDVIAYFDPETNRPEQILEVCSCFDYLLSNPGVLSHQQISTLMQLGILLYNGDPGRIKGASYDLVIDREHLKSGIEVKSGDTFKIDPLDYVVVGAVESVNIPKNICASFDTKVSMFCKGIILSNGPQIDPGYQGRLMCLLFNTSAKEFEVSAAAGFEFATIQFSALSKPSKKPYGGKYYRKERLKEYIGSFADGSIADFVKAIPDMRESIEDLRSNQVELKKRKFTPGHIVITIIVTVLISAIAATYYIGGLNERIGALEKRITYMENLKEKTTKQTPKIPLPRR